jgi:hypothetical protein
MPVFLEVNPQGLYLFIEIQTGLPASKAIAVHLARLESSAADDR